MDLGVFQQWLRAVPLDDASACREQLATLRTLRGILDAREMHIAARLDELQRPTEDDVASAAKSSPFHGARVRSRSTTCETLPQLGEALADGATTGDRIDVVGRALASLSPADRARVVVHGDAIAAAAAELDDRRFRDWLAQLVRRVRVDDGRDRLARQRAAARLRWWNDGDGMWRLDGRFDPVSGAALQGRLRRATEALFADGTATADDAPSDPLDRQQWLQAQALVQLLETSPNSTSPNSTSPGGGSGPDVTVVVDARTLLHGTHAHTRLDTGGFDLPIDTIRRWACLGSVTPVVVGVDGVRLMLGRTTRLASRAQRRALAVWYPTCALCDVAFERCDIHHVHPWEHGGHTDLDNLLPLCTRHHHAVHEGGWRITLQPDRGVEVTFADGSRREFSPSSLAAGP